MWELESILLTPPAFQSAPPTVTKVLSFSNFSVFPAVFWCLNLVIEISQFSSSLASCSESSSSCCPSQLKIKASPGHLPGCPLGGPLVWQRPGDAGGLSRACSSWEEMSLNIGLLTREELYTREAATLASEGKGAHPGRWQVTSAFTAGEDPRWVYQGPLPGVAFRRALGGARVSKVSPGCGQGCQSSLPSLGLAAPSPGLSVNLWSSRLGTSPSGSSLCPAGLGPLGPWDSRP